ncbi:unnamed protein product [Prorocentrum cordatum]|uniref:Trans-3-hydroxy-L-proline dehydratase n=2 Tax=Prorocentrum cordatum TaxID=2364126 RepID=A0ABN9TS70_9DINO|nr:unnamed protein product [Polarella glacialis]
MVAAALAARRPRAGGLGRLAAAGWWAEAAARLRRPAAGGAIRPASAVAAGASSGRRVLQVVDCHAAGEPARVVVGGLPTVPGATMLEKRAHVMEHLDGLRKLLITEPRGYPCQNANLVFPAADPRAAFGFVILEQNKIYPAMSGHNTMCVATALLETGMVPMVEPVTEFVLEAPGGLIRKITAACSNGKATDIRFMNQPAFVAPQCLDLEVEVPQLGTVRLDVAWGGGMWYAVVDAAPLGLELLPMHEELCRAGEMIKVATREQHQVNHPEFDYPGPDIMVFRGPAVSPKASARNVVVMSNGVLDWQRPATWTGMIDRSPCGTGTCAVMATAVPPAGPPWRRGDVARARRAEDRRGLRLRARVHHRHDLHGEAALRGQRPWPGSRRWSPACRARLGSRSWPPSSSSPRIRSPRGTLSGISGASEQACRVHLPPLALSVLPHFAPHYSSMSIASLAAGSLARAGPRRLRRPSASFLFLCGTGAEGLC